MAKKLLYDYSTMGTHKTKEGRDTGIPIITARQFKTCQKEYLCHGCKEMAKYVGRAAQNKV
jgi:hypothetical protein